MHKIGFGGSCHWCTEAIFRSLKGIDTVAQGWIASVGDNTSLSEAVIIGFDETIIDLETLIAVHLHTHSCTTVHAMRGKYRSAIYTFNDAQANLSKKVLTALQADFEQPVITQILPFASFKLNKENYLDYYYKDPTKPFCQNIVNPKLKALLARFAKHIEPARKAYLQNL